MTGRGESINNNGDNDGDFDELEDKIDLAFNDVSLAQDGATLTFSYPDGSKQVTINGNGAGNEVDLSFYYNKTEVDTALALKANDSDMTIALADKADTTDLDAYYLKTETYSQLELNASLALKANDSDMTIALANKADNTDLDAYYLKTETYSQLELDTALALKANDSDMTIALANKADNTDLDSYYLKTETYSQTQSDNLIDNAKTHNEDAIVYNVTIGVDNNGTHKYFINNIQQLELDIIFGKKYIFKHDSAHPLKIGYSDANEYTASFTVDSDTEISFIPFDKDQKDLVYYCANHPDMGASIKVSGGFNYFDKDETYDRQYIDDTLTGKADKTYVDNELDDKADTTDLDDYYTKTETYNQTELIGYLAEKNSVTAFDAGMLLKMNVTDGITAVNLDSSDPSVLQVTKNGSITNINLPAGGGGAGSSTDHPTEGLTGNTSLTNYEVSASENSENAWKAFARGSAGFSTPPATITLTGVWGSAGYNHQLLSHTTGSVVYHMVNTANNNPFGGYGIVFTIVSNQLRLYVNDSTHGWTEPTSFSINGNAASEGDVVNGNDTIALILSNSNITDTFTVPSELASVAFWESSEYADNEIFGAETGGFNIVNNNIWKGLGSPSTTTTTYNGVTYKQKYWTSDHSQNVNLENGYVLHLNKLRASHEYARGAYWESSAGIGDWYIPNLVAGATYKYEIYNSMVKTDHYYPVTVNVIGATTVSTTFTVSGTTDVVASGNINADSNGRITFTMSCGVTNYGYGLSWIRIKGLNYDANGNFLGSSGLTVDSSLVNGNWLKIQIPTFQTLQTVNISELTTGDSVKEFSIYGSSDNSNWTLLQSETSVSLDTYANGGTDYSISTAGNFHYFAVLFTKMYSAVFPKKVKISNVTFTTIPSTGGGSSFQNSMLNGLNLFSNANYNSTTSPPRLELTAYGSGAVTNVNFPSYVSSSDVSTTLNDYYTQTQTTNLLNDYQLTSQLDTAVGNLGYAKTTSSSGISRTDLEDFNQEKADFYVDMVIEPNNDYNGNLGAYWTGIGAASFEIATYKDFSFEMSHITYEYPTTGGATDGNQVVGGNLPCHYYFSLGTLQNDVIPANETTGPYLRFGIESKYSKAYFFSTPPSTINLGSWNWGSYYYNKHSADETDNFVRYTLNRISDSSIVAQSYGIAFYINSNDQLVFTVDPPSHGGGLPLQFGVVVDANPANGSTGYNGEATVNVGDEITLLDTGDVLGKFIVPNVFQVVGQSGVLLDTGYVVEMRTPNSPWNLKLRSQFSAENITNVEYHGVNDNPVVVLNRRTIVRFVYDSSDDSYYFVINGRAEKKRPIDTDFTELTYSGSGYVRMNRYGEQGLYAGNNNKIFLFKWWNARIEADTKSSIKQLRDEIANLKQEIKAEFALSYNAINYAVENQLSNSIFATGRFYQYGYNNRIFEGGTITNFIYSHDGINNNHRRWYRIIVNFDKPINDGAPGGSPQTTTFTSGSPQFITGVSYNVYITEDRIYDTNPEGDITYPNRHKYYNALIKSYVVRNRTNRGFELSIDVDDHTNIDGNAPYAQQAKQPWGFHWIAVNHNDLSPAGYGKPS